MDAPLFAAPAASTAHSTGGGLLEVTLALIVIVALIAGLAWIMKRTRGFGGGAGVRDRIQILGDRSVGQKERCVLVRVGETDILVGVAQGSVRTLHVFPAGANTEAPPAPASSAIKSPNFRDLLMRSLGK
ncbi:MAG TPA: flagellar biosynthetic protein FliO [Steroidobacteraceae bacterium]|jgi:flagellar protein FliO/FliZ|nr:flagellar biosynthetic protein FliO [Steroidobacteraceae bacterium]